jgi:secreted PhoX family phosphatase
MTTDQTRVRLDRRTFLRGSALVAASVAAGGPLHALGVRMAAADESVRQEFSPDYGPLFPTQDQTTGLELLALPRGFEYLTYGWAGDLMDDGQPTPERHDGMAAFRRADGNVALVRNHERGAFTGAFVAPTYDPAANGGTTTLLFDPDRGRFLDSRASLSGTIFNCAGGRTPWGSWLTCEETTVTGPDGTRHGYIFDVPSEGLGDPTPRRAMGRFAHEAVAVDPATGYIYETEDAGTSSGFYRFRPNDRDDLSQGGVLEMLKIGSAPRLTRNDPTGTTYTDTSWVPIANPDPDLLAGEPRVYSQGLAQGAATFNRLEGAHYHAGKIYIVSTNGGPVVRQGQVFEYDPASGVLWVVFASPSRDVLNNPDNIGVSPRGGIVLCEDGSGAEFIQGLTLDGQVFHFAENTAVVPEGGVPGKSTLPGDYRDAEWAGSTFEPKNGNWLFVNLFIPGMTIAITGPWKKGSL